MGLIDILVDYHKMRTYSPEIYAKHISIQMIGHALGWQSFNPNLPPRGVVHNSYICLIGKSGKTKKSTAQNDTIGNLYPRYVQGPTYFSPAALLKALSKKPNMMCQMGEFSQILRSIKYRGNMSDFKEITNDLFTRKNYYNKELVNEEYKITKPYLSLSTTCTQEEFLENISSDMIHGGFLPRWLLVHAQEPKRRKIKIPCNISDYESALMCIINSLYNMKPIKFDFDDETNDLFFDIQCKWEDSPKYDTIQPFVSRYLDYLIKYADILYISDKISNFTKLTGLTNVTGLTDFTKTICNSIDNMSKNSSYMSNNSKISSNSMNSVTLVNSVNSVNSVYLKKSLELIEPCLNYAVDVVSFIDEEQTIGKVLKVMTGKNEMDRSELLRKSHLKGKDFQHAISTLYERNEFYPEVVTSGEGQSKKSKEVIKRK